jgi:tetratricopeptide (TPR) repeat protein
MIMNPGRMDLAFGSVRTFLIAGEIEKRIRRLDRAEMYFNSAWVLAQKFSDAHSLTLAAANALAGLYLMKNKIGPADNLISPLLERNPQFREDPTPLWAPILVTAGKMALLLNQYPKAETLLVKAIAAYDAELGPTHPCLVEPLETLGDLYRQRGEQDRYREVRQRLNLLLVQPADTLEGGNLL